MVAATSDWQFLTFNLAGATVKRVSHGGRQYLVAPASLIVPGVLNGSDGALYYPPDETEKNPGIWNGMPMVVYHPTFNGMPVAAQDPQYKDHVAKSTVGFLRNDRYLGKRVAEAWFDEEHTRNYDLQLPEHVRILPRLNRHEPIEVSTGLHVDRDETPGTCPKTGRAYVAVARNYRPDHLAILPDQRGACSNQDGCGVVMNQIQNADDSDGQWVTLPNGVHMQIKDGEIVKGPKVGKSEGKKGDWRDKFLKDNPKAAKFMEKTGEKKSILDRIKGVAKKIGLTNAEDSDGQWVTLPNGDAAKAKGHLEAAHRHVSAAKLDKGKEPTKNKGRYGNPHDLATGKLLPHGSGTGLGEVHGAAVEGHRGESCKCGGCDKCKATQNSNPEGINQYTKSAGAAHEAGEKVWRAKGQSNKEMSKLAKSASKAHFKAMKSAPSDMAKHHEQQGGMYEISSRVFADRHRADPKSTHKGQVQNQLGSGVNQAVTEGDSAMATAVKLSAGERQGLVSKIVANCQCEGGDDATVINSLSDAALMQLNAVAEAAPEDESAVESEVEQPAPNSPKGKFGKKPVPPQFAANMTAQQWLDAAPPEIRSAVTNAVKIERSARQDLIAKLVANVASDSKKKYETFLSNKSLDELETLVEMIPATTRNAESEGLFGPVFLGAAGGHEGQSPTKNRDAMTFNADADPEMDPSYASRQLAAK